MAFGNITRKTLGISNSEKAFDRFYRNYGIPATSDGGTATPPLDKVLDDPLVKERFKGWAAANLMAYGKVAEENDVEGARSVLKNWVDSKGDLWDRAGEKAILGDHSKATPAVTRASTDSSVVGIPSSDGAVPLVYDPDILELKKAAAPAFEELNVRGQEGFKAVANRIDQGGTIGFVTESDSADLSDNTASNSSYNQVEKEMEIMVDLLEVTDFAQEGTAFQFDLRNSQLGQRLAGLMQLREQAVLYGDSSLATGTGGIGDSNAYDGFETDIENNNSSNHIDKSSTDITGSAGLIQDIKTEVKERLQSDQAVAPDDLMIVTSHTVQDQLEADAQDYVRVDTADGMNVGGERISIHGVEVVPTHNVDTHTDSGNDIGDEGDVFLLDRRSAEYRQLMPMSTVPLERQGFAERVGIGEFGAPILRANAEWSKFLSAYSVTQLT